MNSAFRQRLCAFTKPKACSFARPCTSMISLPTQQHDPNSRRRRGHLAFIPSRPQGQPRRWQWHQSVCAQSSECILKLDKREGGREDGRISLSLSSPLPPRHEIVSAPNDIYCPPCHQLPLLFVGPLQARAFGRGTPLGCRRWGKCVRGPGPSFL